MSRARSATSCHAIVWAVSGEVSQTSSGPPAALALLGVGIPAIGACIAAPYMLDPQSPAATSSALMMFQAGAITNCAVYAGVPLLLVPAAAQRFGQGCAAQVYWRTWIALPIANVMATGFLSRSRDAMTASASTATSAAGSAWAASGLRSRSRT